MKLAYFTPLAPERLGGIETLAGDVVPALRRRGHQVTLIHSHDQEIVEQDRVLLPFLTAVEARDPVLILELGRKLDRVVESHDLVLYQFSPFTVLWAGRPGPPQIMTVHHPVTPQQLALLQKVAGRMACLTTVSVASQNDLAACSLASEVVLPGLQFGPPPPRQPRPSSLLAAGRMAPEKGFDLLLRAVARLAPRWPDLELKLVGAGPEESALRALIAELELEDRVEIPGARNRRTLTAMMAASAMVVMPSRLEPFGLVALEASAVGCPVVCSRVGGLPEHQLHDQTGLLVEPDRADLLAAAIEELLADPERAERLGQGGLRHARAHFTADAYAEGLESVCCKSLPEP